MSKNANKHTIIEKAIEHYKYEDVIQFEIEGLEFYNRYEFSYKNYIRNKFDFQNFWNVLGRVPRIDHIAAKNLLFQNNPDCWKYFERTALFWTMAHINDPFIDHIKNEFEYALFTNRDDLLEILINKSFVYLKMQDYKTNKEFINQKIYPSTHLIHFLIEKWLGENPVKSIILNFGDGYGIYQKLIDHWNDFSLIEPQYWDELCEYHLNSIGLQRGDNRKHEEFLGCGLIPMEIINIFKVRKKLGLEIPEINHELFQTPMAKFPVLPTGYDQELDVKFQLVKRTVETKRKYTYQEIIDLLKNEHGEDADLFY